MGNVLYIVVPCYNEQEVLPETAKRLRTKLEVLVEQRKIDAESRILFVNDGSKDATWLSIEELYRENPVYAGVNLSRNRGHQNTIGIIGEYIGKTYMETKGRPKFIVESVLLRGEDEQDLPVTERE